MNEIITSAKNPKVMQLQKLMQKKYRDEEGLFLIEGLRFVEEALQSKADVLEIYLREDTTERYPNFAQLIPANMPVYFFTEQLFKKFTETEHPQGIAALIRKQSSNPNEVLAGQNPLVLILDQVQDPGNLGTLIRTADAAGVTGCIIVKGSADLYNPKTLRATMGSVFHVPHIVTDTIEEACSAVKEKGIKVVTTDVSAEAIAYTQADLTGGMALVIGNEARGSSDYAKTAADQLITINMPGKAESLNVAMATGIILFEAVRQRELAKG